MHASTHIRVYNLAECITFRKTNESFGGLSNMASGYVLWVNNTRILTSEAIYQASRFPHMPEVQRSIIMQGSPMTAKMKSKPFRDQSRADWNSVRLGIMRWCLRVKLAQHWDKFGELLLRTGDKPIVEDSRKDQFWGAVKNENGQLEGRNALGRLLMELREELKGPERERLRTVKPLDIPDFLLYGQPIGLVEARATKAEEDTTGRRLKPLGIRRPDEPVKTYAPPATKADLFSEPEDPMQEKEPKPKEPLKPYPAYKPAGVPWLQQVPEHWGFERAKSVFRGIDVKSKTGKEELLTVSSANGIVKRRESNVNMFKAKTYVGHKLCWPEDLVINSLWAWGRGLGFSREHGIISTAYGVYRLREPHKHLWLYLNYTLRSSVYQWELQVRSKGVWKSRLQLTDASFFDMPILMPPKEDAELIVRYLHALDAKVKRYIRTKRSLIARLQEQKQAIIQRAVTRGLDPNANLKPSGVEWLGEVPEHWEVKKLKRLGTVRIGLTYSPGHLTGDTGTLVLRASNIRNGRIVYADNVYVSKQIPEQLKVVKGDVLICVRSGSRSLVGKSAMIPEEFHGVSYGAFMSLFRGTNYEYVYWVLNSNLLPSVMAQFETSTINQLTQSDLRNLTIPVPPESEILQITSYLSAATSKVDQVIALVEKDLAAIKEYHTRLIADVVTGAVDVREAAKAIEEVAPAEETMDEAIELEAEVEEELDTNE